MFYVKNWETNEVISQHDSLSAARRNAKKQGHTGEDIRQLTCYPPVAFVADSKGYLVYNPRFSKKATR